MKSMKLAPIMFPIFLISCVSFASVPKDIEINDKLKTGERLSIVLAFATIDDKFVYENPSWWGAEFAPPEYISSSIRVALNSRQCWVPFSSYSDLVNVKSAKLHVSGEGFQITIDGGESATHYIAILKFDNECYITSRKVYSPTFPDQVWAETKYSFIRRKDI